MAQSFSLSNSLISGSRISGIYIPAPKIDYQFALDGTLTPRIGPTPVFSRTGSATYFNSSGTLSYSNTNTPRFDYDPITLEPLGLLLEAAAFNLITDSVAPTGSRTIDLPFSTALPMVLSFYGSGTITYINDIELGPTILNGNPNPKVRTIVPLLFNTELSGPPTLVFSGNIGYAQLESGYYPSSYIPSSVNNTGVRYDETLFLRGFDFSSTFNQSEGTIVSSSSRNYSNPTAGSASYVYTIDDDSFNYRHTYKHDVAVAQSYVNNVRTVNMNFNQNPALGQVTKTAYAYKSGLYRGRSSVNPIPKTDIATNVPTSLNRISFGARRDGSDPLNGYIRSFTYYNTRLSDRQIDSLGTI